MFHRVKPESETETEESQESKPQTSQESSPPPQVQKLQAKLQEQKAQEKPAQPSPKNQPTPKKDKVMSEQTQDTKSQEQSEEQAAPEQARAAGTSTGGSSPYSPASQPQAPASSGYPGAYKGSSYTPPSTEVSAEGRTLTVGDGITMSGEIEACDHLVVQGTVEAALKGARVLDIEESGTFYGTVEIDEATVAGRFEGDITVNGRLTVRSSGVVVGSIAYGELEVEAGAVIDGKITPVSALPAQKEKPIEAAQPKPAPVKAKEAQVSKEERPEPANTDGELFSSKTAVGE